MGTPASSANHSRRRRLPAHSLGRLTLTLGAAALALSCATTPTGTHADVGLCNFDVVAAGILYRGAQPEPSGYQELRKLGIRTVLNLRLENDTQAREKAAVEAAGMRYRALPMRGFGAPTEEQIRQALAVIDDPANQPVFVHCRRGADRTGTVVAAYEIRVRCVDNGQALREAEEHGMSPLELAMKRFVRALAQPSSCSRTGATPAPGAPRTSPAYTP